MTYSSVALNSRTQKSFQFRAHRRPEYIYSSFHNKLDLALRYLYSRKSLEKIVIEKGYLESTTLHRLDHAICDIWYAVVFMKIPATIPYKKSICKFISKKDFLNQLHESAIAASHEVADVGCHRRKVVDYYAKSAKTGDFYDLHLSEEKITCSCPGYSALATAFGEDSKMTELLLKHPVLQGQIPDKHAMAIWKHLACVTRIEYQQQYRQILERSQFKEKIVQELKSYGLSLRPTGTTGGHFDAFTTSGKVGTVDQRFDVSGKFWWINQEKLGLDRCVPADHIHYGTAEEAVIGLVKHLNIVAHGIVAAADLFGGDWDISESEQLERQQSSELLLNLTQSKSGQLMSSVSSNNNKKVLVDPFGGF